MSSETFGAVLRELRERAGLSQRTVAERAGESPSTLSRFERSERTHMTTPRAAVWADALHLKTTDRARLLALAQPVVDFSTPTKRDARVRGDQSPIVCDHPLTEVLDSRRTPGGGIRRRRMCISCGLRVTTYEQTTPIKRPKDRPSASTSANPDVAGLIRDALNAVTTQRAATRSSAARMVMDDVIADLESAYAGIEELREGDERQAA